MYLEMAAVFNFLIKEFMFRSAAHLIGTTGEVKNGDASFIMMVHILFNTFNKNTIPNICFILLTITTTNSIINTTYIL